MSIKDYFTWRKSDPLTPEEERRKILEAEKKEATRKKKPWVAVLDTSVDPKNVTNGFFELDWNNEFVEMLVDHGYIGSTQEEIVEKWFKSVARQILAEGIES